jgi:BON domain
MRYLVSSALTCAAMVALSATAEAQFSGGNTGSRGTTTNGMFGTTSLGGASALSTPGAQGAGGFGQPGAGMGQTGGIGQGMGLNIGAPSMTQSAFVGASSQNSMNIRSMQGGQPGGQGMTGMQQGRGGAMGGAGGLQGIGGRGGAGGISGLRNSLQGNRQNSFNSQQAQRSQQGGSRGQNQIRVPLRLGFQPPAIAAPRFNTSSSDRLAKTSSLQRVGAINVSLEGRTAILRGTVASESDRQLAASLARLEPEVLVVQNELVVESAGTTGEELPPVPPTAAR